MLLLDCNDASLRLWRDQQDTWSPGFAWFSEGRYQFGEVAWQQARRVPREVNNRYWHRLSTQALSPALGPARHTADLAHEHLETLLNGVSGELTLIIPGSMEADQLSLLLGILQTLPVTVSSVVHRSALAGAAAGQSCAHVELQLHQASITPVFVEHTLARAGETQLLPGHGLLGLMDEIAELIGQQFVAQTRFDPQRRADTEQSLYQQIPDLLRSLATQSEVNCTLDGHAARISADILQSVGAAFSKALSPLIHHDVTHIALDALLSVLPGLNLPHPASTISADALPRIASAMPAQDGELTFQREAPCDDTLPAADASSKAATVSHESLSFSVTHQLVAGHATPLASGASLAAGVVISGQSEITIQPNAQAQLNDRATEGVMMLKAGDRLSVSGIEIQFITVEP
jgi:hypothetical protein